MSSPFFSNVPAAIIKENAGAAHQNYAPLILKAAHRKKQFMSD